MKISTPTYGLLVFIIVSIVNIAALLLDSFLVLTNYPTITEIARSHLWLAVFIIIWQVIGTIGLTIHFWWGKKSGGERNLESRI